MSIEKVRLAVMQHHVNAAASLDRAARLLDRIKLETHWLLISTPARTFTIDAATYAQDRAKLVAIWPAIRHRRLDPANAFYDLIGDQASLLTHLIEIRRQRAQDRGVQ